MICAMADPSPHPLFGEVLSIVWHAGVASINGDRLRGRRPRVLAAGFFALLLLFALCEHLSGEQRCLTSRGCPRFRSLKVWHAAFMTTARQAGKAQASRVAILKPTGGMGLKSGEGAESELGNLVVLRLAQRSMWGLHPRAVHVWSYSFPMHLAFASSPL